jgi:CAAX prenyl protease-like protein
MLLLAAGEAVAHFGTGLEAWWLAEPKYWVFPAQTVLCAGLLAWWWRDYRFATGRAWWWSLLLGLAAGLLALGVWVAPQELFGAERRLGGFDPWFFGGGEAFQWNTGLRVLRLVIVVPLLEEIFWRGFLLRHLVRDPFHEVPVGAFTWLSFVAVSLLFGLAHWGPDFVPAILTGALYNLVAIFTRSLGACVLAHAVTNLGLGLYIFRTQQWGFW